MSSIELTPKKALDVVIFGQNTARAKGPTLLRLKEAVKVTEFAEDFLEQDGLNELLKVATTKDIEESLQGIVLQAVVGLLVYENALDQVEDSQELVDRIYSILMMPHVLKSLKGSASKPVVEILVVICGRFPEGYNMVLQAAQAKHGVDFKPFSCLIPLLDSPDLTAVKPTLLLLNLLLKKRKQNDDDLAVKELLFQWERCGLMSVVQRLSDRSYEDDTIKRGLQTFQQMSNITIPKSWRAAATYQAKFEEMRQQFEEQGEKLFIYQQQQAKMRMLKLELGKAQETIKALNMLAPGSSSNYHPTKRFSDGGGIPLAQLCSNNKVELDITSATQEIAETRKKIFEQFVTDPGIRAVAVKQFGKTVTHVAGPGGKGGRRGRLDALAGLGADDDFLPPEDFDEFGAPPPEEEWGAPPPDPDDGFGMPPPPEEEFGMPPPPEEEYGMPPPPPEAGEGGMPPPPSEGAVGPDGVPASGLPPPADGSAPPAADGAAQGLPPASLGEQTINAPATQHVDPATGQPVPVEATPVEGLPPPPSGIVPGLPPPPGGAIPGLPPPPGGHIPGLPPPPGAHGLPPPPGAGGLPPPPGAGGFGAPKPAGRQFYDGPAPSKKMKPFHWEKQDLPKEPGSVWHRIHDGDKKTGVKPLNLAFDYEEFESMYSQKDRTHEDKPDKPKKKEVVLMIDGRVFQNMSIALRKLPTIPNIQRAIMSLDDEILPRDLLWAVVENVPAPDVVKQFNSKQGAKEVEEYEPPEQFIALTLTLPAFKARCSTWLFTQDFEENARGVVKPVLRLTAAMEAIPQSKHLPYFLGLLLGFGNMMNHGNNMKGNAAAIPLSTFGKLDATKDNRGKISLMQHLFSVVKKENPDALDLCEELKPLLNNVSQVKMEDLERGMAECEKELKQFGMQVTIVKKKIAEVGADEDDAYVPRMVEFQLRAEELLKELQGEFTKCKDSVAAVLKYFSPKRPLKPEEIIGDLIPFIERVKKEASEAAKEKKRHAKKGKKVGEDLNQLVGKLQESMVN